MSKLELVNELHRQARRHFPRRSTIMRGLNDTLQADLVEMIPYAKQNNGLKYILTVINIFSKKGYAYALKNKTGKEVTKAMKSILDSLGHPIVNLHVDNGKEFYNKSMKSMLEKRNINLYSTFSTKKAAICERFNRTLKNKMWKRFSFNGSHKWVNILQSLINDYNNSIHRTIKMKPNDVTYDDEEYLLNTVYRSNVNTPPYKKMKAKFKIDDFVRISKYKHVFAKGFTPNWTTEIFKIRRVQETFPITYLLVDFQGNDIQGSFYNEELLLVKDPKLFLVERIIKKKDDKLFVKWLGFDSSHNSWINKDSVVD